MIQKALRAAMRTDARGMILLRNTHLARKEYKSLMSEGYRELKRTCPLCSTVFMKELKEACTCPAEIIKIPEIRDFSQK